MEKYGETISIDTLNIRTPGYVNRRIHKSIAQKGWQEIWIEFDPDLPGYPNICAPIAGLLDHYRDEGVSVECCWKGVDRANGQRKTYLQHTMFDSPKTVREHIENGGLVRPLDVVWKYSDSVEVNALVNSVVQEMLAKTSLESGVISGIEWCLNEVMDNVLQHSVSGIGYFMASYQPGNHILSICVYDNGVGILNSFSASVHNPNSALDAITMALQERVTRDEHIGQGNGMWGMSEIVQKNGGSFKVVSHGASYSYEHGRSLTEEQNEGVSFFDRKLGTTLVDFQLYCNREIDIAVALKGYEPTLLWLEDLESPSGDDVIISIAGLSEGTGTRKAGEKLRTYVLNVMKESKKRVVLDFQGVTLVSSSFADELIGKMVIEIGFSVFNQFVVIGNLSKSNKYVVDKSVQQRMAQTYYDSTIPDIE